MNVGSPTETAGGQAAEGVGYAHITDDSKDSTTLKEGRGIAKTQVSNEH
jgi:hypothetical protein